jgi:hypothetical protein
MVQVNEGDGKTRETAIRIMCAEDRKEGWDYIIENIKAFGFEEGDGEYSSISDEDGYETHWVVYRKDDNEIWFDWTWLYEFMR